jgi:hypothetical protein
MNHNNSETFEPQLITSAKEGKEPTSESIRQGTVRMEGHPDYEQAIQTAKDAGFEIKKSGFARVEVLEIYNQEGNYLRVEKILHVLEGMRYIDLEHELGHIEQLGRFGVEVFPTDKLVELPNGHRYRYKIRDGILTVPQASIFEYHNRLVEYIRLAERNVESDVLIEHARGVEYWKKESWRKGLSKGNSPKKQAWANRYFGDIKKLAKQYLKIIQTLTQAN